MPGIRVAEFNDHIRMLNKYYQIITLNDAHKFLNSDPYPNVKNSILLTFDDGLSDHYLAAKILSKHGIKGTFFIPTCILIDKLPANPTIIHYCLAIYGIQKFLVMYRSALRKYNISMSKYNVSFKKGIDNPLGIILNVKSILKYKLKHNIARKILLYIYKNSLLRDYPNAMEIMHLTQDQISKMTKMGHSVGPHSHTHISIASARLTEKDFVKEVINPKKILEDLFHVPVIAFSYPFGLRQDCLTQQELVNKKTEYKLAFTIEEAVNTKNTPSFELNRCSVEIRNRNNVKNLKNDLEKNINANSYIHK